MVIVPSLLVLISTIFDLSPLCSKVNMLAWDPHLNQSVAVKVVNLNGTPHSYFNPNNFTGEPFFLHLPNLESGHQLYAFNYVADCVFPITGIYCPLNRWLFYAEVIFGLTTLSLGYEWLSMIAIAAALNYTAVAAIHAIILFFVKSSTPLYFSYDQNVLYVILIASVLFAHPLQQWSQTLQKNTFAKTRIILACWCVLVCIAFILTDRSNGPTVQLGTEVDSSSQFSLPFAINEVTCDDCYNDTINSFQLFVTPKEWEDGHGIVRSCPTPNPSFVSSLQPATSIVRPYRTWTPS